MLKSQHTHWVEVKRKTVRLKHHLKSYLSPALISTQTRPRASVNHTFWAVFCVLNVYNFANSASYLSIRSVHRIRSYLFIFFFFDLRPKRIPFFSFFYSFFFFQQKIYSKSNFIALFLLFPTLHTIQFKNWCERNVKRECVVFDFEYIVCYELWVDATLAFMSVYKKNHVYVCVCVDCVCRENKKFGKIPLFMLCSVFDSFFRVFCNVS